MSSFYNYIAGGPETHFEQPAEPARQKQRINRRCTEDDLQSLDLDNDIQDEMHYIGSSQYAQREAAHQFLNDDKSFVSDFQDDPLLPQFIERNTPQHAAQASQGYLQGEIPHQNNQVLNKLSGYKRRKHTEADEGYVVQPQHSRQATRHPRTNHEEPVDYEPDYYGQQQTPQSYAMKVAAIHEVNSTLSASANSSVHSSFHSNQKQSQQEHEPQQQQHLRPTGVVNKRGSKQQVKLNNNPVNHNVFETSFDQSDFGPGAPIASVDSAAELRKIKNREAAIRSRQKKKFEQDYQHGKLDKVNKENNKLKLENAALKAENQILKRQLHYFENLFAKKTQSTMSMTNSSTSVVSREDTASQSGRSGVVLNEKILHMHNAQLQKQQLHGGPHSEQHGVGGLHIRKKAASTGHIYNEVDDEELNKTTSEVSFVLERNPGQPESPGGKIGLFSVALVMCICCFSAFFTPDSAVMGGAQVIGVPQTNTHSIGMQIAEFGTQPSNTIPLTTAEIPLTPTQPSPTQTLSPSQIQQHANHQHQANTFFGLLMISLYANILKLVFLVAFAFAIILFPKDEIVQWAARKPFLRKIFDFTDVPMAAQTKFIKSTKLV